MSTTLEERVAALESRLEGLERKASPTEAEPQTPWWEKIRGAFKDDPIYDEITLRGAEWRRSQPIAGDELEPSDAIPLHP